MRKNQKLQLYLSKEIRDSMLDFEQVWRDIQTIASIKKIMFTLSYKVKNTISFYNNDVIVVQSERTSRPRELLKKDFHQFWQVILEQKQIVMKDFYKQTKKFPWNGRIITAFLAHLPYVEYSTKPQTLYLMEDRTHEIGTTRRRSHSSTMHT